MLEHKTQFYSEDKRYHIAKLNILNLVHPNQHPDIEIPHGLRNHVIVPDTVKILHNLDIESTSKTRRISNKMRRIIVN